MSGKTRRRRNPAFRSSSTKQRSDTSSDVLAQRDVNVVLMTPNPLRWTPKMLEMYGKPPYLPDDEDGFNTMLSAYAERVRQIAATENVPLIDVYRSFEDFGKTDGQSVQDLLLDGIHPNDRGHRLVADQLLAQLLKTGKSIALGSRAKIELRISTNPTNSSLSDANSKATQVRFEDYVSNPPPNCRDPLQGWVGQFSTPFHRTRDTPGNEYNRRAAARPDWPLDRKLGRHGGILRSKFAGGLCRRASRQADLSFC